MTIVTVHRSSSKRRRQAHPQGEDGMHLRRVRHVTLDWTPDRGLSVPLFWGAVQTWRGPPSDQVHRAPRCGRTHRAMVGASPPNAPPASRTGHPPHREVQGRPRHGDDRLGVWPGFRMRLGLREVRPLGRSWLPSLCRGNDTPPPRRCLGSAKCHAGPKLKQWGVRYT
jgi:hypothetical protein